jgi:hypothetical protein
LEELWRMGEEREERERDGRMERYLDAAARHGSL